MLILDLTSEWGTALEMLAEKLKAKLRGKLAYIAASPSPDTLAYDSNVLVVLRGLSPGDVRVVMEAKREVEAELGERVLISPLVTELGDKLARRFMKAVSGSQQAPEWLWSKAVSSLKSKLEAKLRDKLVGVKALPSEEPLAYDSNVLVVLRGLSPGDVRVVMEAKREVEAELGERVLISPLVTELGDKLARRFPGRWV